MNRLSPSMTSHIYPFFLTLALVLSIPVAASAQEAIEIDVVHRGSFIRGAFGIHFARGKLWVASPLGREIVSLDPETGTVLERFGPEQGIETPDDLVFGPDGSLYWTAVFADSVGRLSSAGELTYQMIGPFTNGITFSPDGRLYLSQCTVPGATGLWELDPQLRKAPRLIADDLGEGCSVNGMDVGEDGQIYGPRFFIGDVVRIDPDTGDFVVLADGFEIPSAVKLDGAGRVHVIENSTGRVYRLDRDEKQLLATLAPGIDGMDFDPLDRLFVSRNIDGTVYRVDSDGTVEIIREGGLVAPGGLALSSPPQGEASLFVADLTSLTEFDPRSGERIGLELSNDRVAFRRPFTVSSEESEAERLVITSWFDNAVQVYDPRSRVLLENYSDFQVPTNATTFAGQLIVAEALTGRVLSVRDGEERELITDLLLPTGLLATDRALWITDWGTGILWQLARDGAFLEQPVEFVTGLVTPEGLARDVDGALLVVESAFSQIKRLDPVTGESSILASGLDLGAQFVPDFGLPSVFHSGLAVSKSGEIWLGSDFERRLYRLQRKEHCETDGFASCLLAGKFRVDLDFRFNAQKRGRARTLDLNALVPSASWAFFLEPASARLLGAIRIQDRCATMGLYEIFGLSLAEAELHFGINDTVSGRFQQQSTLQSSSEGPVIWRLPTAFPCMNQSRSHKTSSR